MHFKESGSSANYFKIAALEAALITYLVCGSFINRFRGELLYWLVMFISASVWIYLRDTKQNATEEN